MANLYLFSIDGDSHMLVELTDEKVNRIREVVDRFKIPCAISPIELLPYEAFVEMWRTFDMPEISSANVSAADLFNGRISF